MIKLWLLIIKLLAKLPLVALYLLADFIAFVLFHFIRYRRKIVRGNLITSFPEKSQEEINRIEKDFYRFLGDQIVETLKLFHISDKELAERVKFINPEIANKSLEKGKNIVILMGHYCNWEWVQQVSRSFLPSASMFSIYHPLHNKVWDRIFILLRSRWGAHIIPQMKAPRALLSKENQPWVCGFIADARPPVRHDDSWIEFLNHKTWFIYGPEEIGNKVGADFFYLEMTKIKRGYYEIKLFPLSGDIPLKTQGSQPSFPVTRQFWRLFEETIKKAPAYWLWSHNRWK